MPGLSANSKVERETLSTDEGVAGVAGVSRSVVCLRDGTRAARPDSRGLGDRPSSVDIDEAYGDVAMLDGDESVGTGDGEGEAVRGVTSPSTAASERDDRRRRTLRGLDDVFEQRSGSLDWRVDGPELERAEPGHGCRAGRGRDGP